MNYAPLLPEEGLVLVVGIGNDHITPDALGPLAGERILATRHIGPELARSIGMEHLRPVAGLLPGVLGQTGIEQGDYCRRRPSGPPCCCDHSRRSGGAETIPAGVYHSDEQQRASHLAPASATPAQRSTRRP